MQNIPTLSDLDGMSPADLAGLSLETLAMLQDQAKAEADALKRRTALLDTTLADRFADHLNGFGKTRIEQDDHEVEIDRPKRVEWNDEQLAKVEEQLEQIGWDPFDFITIKRSVSEATYKALPTPMRPAFEAARTEKPGKPKFTIKKKGLV